MMTKVLQVSVISFVLLSTSNFAVANEDVGKKTYNQVCSACHDSGAAGAPELGDKFAWKSRIKKGKDALYSSALNGFGGMPARGGMSSLTDAQVKAVVNYMIAKGS